MLSYIICEDEEMTCMKPMNLLFTSLTLYKSKNQLAGDDFLKDGFTIVGIYYIVLIISFLNLEDLEKDG